jgi:ribosomal protein S17
MNRYLKSIYFDPSHPAGFSSVLKLYRAARGAGKKYTLKDVKRFLAGLDTYTSHRRVIKKFPRSKTTSPGLGILWQSDLADFKSLAHANDGHTFVLFCIDIFSRFTYAVPLRSKSNPEMIRGFTKIFKMSKTIPHSIGTDSGMEYKGRLVQNFFRKHEINHFTVKSNTDHKAAVVERTIRTVKDKLYKYFTYSGSYRYLEVLPAIMKSYNESVHSAIKASPSSVTPENQFFFWRRYHSPMADKSLIKPFTFNVGDTVRISKSRHKFARGFKSGWSLEQFKIIKRITRKPVNVYVLEDLNGEKIEGIFYPYEMQLSLKTVDAFHAVEKIIKSRGSGRSKKYLVRWKDFSSKFDSWVKASDFKSGPPV